MNLADRSKPKITNENDDYIQIIQIRYQKICHNTFANLTSTNWIQRICKQLQREIMCICVYVRNQYMYVYEYDYLRRDREMEIGTPISVCLWRKRLLLAWNYILDELTELKRYSHFHPNTAELTHFGLNPLQWRNDEMPVWPLWVSNGAGNNYFYFLIVCRLHTTI